MSDRNTKKFRLFIEYGYLIKNEKQVSFKSDKMKKIQKHKYQLIRFKLDIITKHFKYKFLISF